MIVRFSASECYLASVRRDNEKGLDGMFAKKGVSLVPVARLHLVISVQTFQSGSGDMNLTVWTNKTFF